MVWGLELRVQILRFGVEGSWLGLQGARCVVQARRKRFKVEDLKRFKV